MARSFTLAGAIAAVSAFTTTGITLGQDAAPGLGGPSSVHQMLSTTMREPLASQFDLGFDYSAMGQSAVNGGTTNAASGAARLYGSVDLYGGGAAPSGQLTTKIENRHRLGTDIAPQDLGFSVGYIGLPAISFSDAGWLLTNLFWQHTSREDRWAVIAGITDVTDYVDVYALGNPWSEFSNLAFSTNPTIPSPNQGLGFAGRIRIGQNVYVLAGLANANGEPSDPFRSVADFRSEPEIFAHAEFGWVEKWDSRFENNVHLTVWHADARKSAGVSSGQGMAMSASWRIADRFLPFARVGLSDGGGALIDRSASAGLGFDAGRDTGSIALGVNWARPNPKTYGVDNDQLTIEAYWRFSPLAWLEVTPDVQYVHNPAYYATEDDLWLLGLRVRAVF